MAQKQKKRYFLTNYLKCGAMPLYLIFFRDQRGFSEHRVMLCSFRKLRKLLRQVHGFDNPDDYGKVVYAGKSATPNQLLKAMIRSRYDFDLDQPSIAGMDKR